MFFESFNELSDGIGRLFKAVVIQFFRNLSAGQWAKGRGRNDGCRAPSAVCIEIRHAQP